MDIAPGKVIPLLLAHASAEDRARVQSLSDSITFLARVEVPRLLEQSETAPQSATALLGDMSLLVPMAGLIDKDAEISRLERQVTKLEADMAKTEARVSNPNFGKAPEHVQQQARDLLARQTSDLDALRQQVERIRSL